MRGWLMLSLAACAGTTVPGVEVVELRAADGELLQQLAVQRARANADTRCSVVQIYADWCQPCRSLRAGMDDPLMQQAFRGVQVVRLELGAWDVQLRKQVEDFDVPVFFEVLPNGHLGRTLDGTAWTDDVPAQMAPPLSAFFDQVCPTRRP